MKLRPYHEQTDFPHLITWIDSPRTHALWCADLLPYPVTADALRKYLEKEKLSACTAVSEDNRPVGFFCCSSDERTNVCFFRFIIIDPSARGKGYGTTMIRQAVQLAFSNPQTTAVQLNVFTGNPGARRCYEKVGLTEKFTEKDCFLWKGELWSRSRMECPAHTFSESEKNT